MDAKREHAHVDLNWHGVGRYGVIGLVDHARTEAIAEALARTLEDAIEHAPDPPIYPLHKPLWL